MKTIVKAVLVAVSVGGVLALPVQEAGAATKCTTVIKHGVATKVCKPVRYKTVCTVSHGVKHCRKVAY